MNGRNNNTLFQIFISHKAEEKKYASSLKEKLDAYGFESFVAHEDIEPTADWMQEIICRLRECDAFVYLASSESNSSPFCQQEIGWAYARIIPMIPIAINDIPEGFFSMKQAIRMGNEFNPDTLAKSVFQALMNNSDVTARIVDVLVTRLEKSCCYDESNQIASLIDLAPSITPSQAAVIERAIKSNSQVCDADFRRLPNKLRRMIDKKMTKKQ